MSGVTQPQYYGTILLVMNGMTFDMSPKHIDNTSKSLVRLGSYMLGSENEDNYNVNAAPLSKAVPRTAVPPFDPTYNFLPISETTVMDFTLHPKPPNLHTRT